MAAQEPAPEPITFGTAEVPFKQTAAKAAFDAGGVAGLETYLKKYFARTSKFYLLKNPHESVQLHTAQELSNMFPYKYGDNKVSPSAMIKAFDFVRLVNDPTKPQQYEENGQTFINMFEGWLFEDTDIPPTAAELKLIQPFLDHIKTVWADGDEIVYKFILRWFARISQKQKNVVGLYLMSEQGTGKSAPFEIMLLHVFGKAAAHMVDSPETITGFNSELAGKMMLVLEEMPTASNSEYHALSNLLKMVITASTFQLRKKFADNTNIPNVLSTAVCANREALMLESSDRRWLKLDIDSKYVGDEKYFKRLYEPFEKKGAGKVMWAYLQTMDLCGHDDRKPPMTKSKQLQTMPKAAKWLKEKFLLQNKAFDEQTLSKAYADYCTWACMSKGREQGVNPFSAELEKIGFTHQRKRETVNGKRSVSLTKHMHEFSVKRMYETFSKSGWITDADDIPFITGNAPRKAQSQGPVFTAAEVEEMYIADCRENIRERLRLAAIEQKKEAKEMEAAFHACEEKKPAPKKVAAAKKAPVAAKKAPVAAKKAPARDVEYKAPKNAKAPKPTKVVQRGDAYTHEHGAGAFEAFEAMA